MPLDFYIYFLPIVFGIVGMTIILSSYFYFSYYLLKHGGDKTIKVIGFLFLITGLFLLPVICRLNYAELFGSKIESPEQIIVFIAWVWYIMSDWVLMNAYLLAL